MAVNWGQLVDDRVGLMGFVIDSKMELSNLIIVHINIFATYMMSVFLVPP